MLDPRLPEKLRLPSTDDQTNSQQNLQIAAKAEKDQQTSPSVEIASNTPGSNEPVVKSSSFHMSPMAEQLQNEAQTHPQLPTNPP